MSYSKFKQSAQNHLSKWIRTIHPNIKEGEYNSKNGVVSYPHILPLDGTTKDKKEAIIKAINRYHVLTDDVKFNEKVFPKKELHHLAHHLTSSQILCYNFFSLFLREELCNSREMKITPTLRDWLHKSFPDIPIMSESAKCEFEYKFNDEEGTSFDFCIFDDSTTILFEIKYTENGFGKAKQDDYHETKFQKIYKDLLKKQDTVDKDVKSKEFFKNYQLFRNAIRTNANTYFVVIYPEDNMLCHNGYEDFKSKWLVHPERIKSITWEKAFKHKTVANSALKSKYGF